MKERTYNKRARMDGKNQNVCQGCGQNHHFEKRIVSANRRKLERIMRRDKRRRYRRIRPVTPEEYMGLMAYAMFEESLVSSLYRRLAERDYGYHYMGLVKNPSTNIKMTAL